MKKLGVEPADYTLYLKGVYRCDASDLTNAQISEQVGHISEALEDVDVRPRFKAAVLKVALALRDRA
jgi:hypothetical protein